MKIPNFLHKKYQAVVVVVGRLSWYSQRSPKRGSPGRNKAKKGLYSKITVETEGDGRKLLSAITENARVKINSGDRNPHRITVLNGGGINAEHVFYYDDDMPEHKDRFFISCGTGFVGLPDSMNTATRQAMKQLQDRKRHWPRKRHGKR